MPLDEVAQAIGLAWMVMGPVGALILAVIAIRRRFRNHRTPAATRPHQDGRHRRPAQEHHQ